MRCSSCDHDRPLGTLMTSRPDPGEGEADYPALLMCTDRSACRRRSDKTIDQITTGATQ